MDALATQSTPTTQPRILGERPVKITARDVNVYYGDKHAIKNLSIDIPEGADVRSIYIASACDVPEIRDLLPLLASLTRD